MVMQRIVDLERQHAQLLASLEPEWKRETFTKRLEEVFQQREGARKWQFPVIVPDEGAFRKAATAGDPSITSKP